MTKKEFIKEIKLIDKDFDVLKKKREVLTETFLKTNAKFTKDNHVYWGNMPVFIRGIYHVKYKDGKVNIYYSIGSLTKSGEIFKNSYLGNVPENQLSKYENS